MESAEAIAVVDRALSKIPGLHRSHLHSPEHVEFVQTTGVEIAQVFGSDSTVARNLACITYADTGSVLTSAFTYQEDMARAREEAYQRGLNVAEGILRSARHLLETHGADNLLRASRVRNDGARVFISHGREGPALTKLERFVRALGLVPIIVIRVLANTQMRPRPNT